MREFDLDAVRPPALGERRVVIPGGTGGVGEGVVRAWLRSEAHVVVPTRGGGAAEALRSLLGPLGSSERLSFVEAPYGTFEEAEALASRIVADFGPVTDVVPSIGGWWSGGGLWEVTDEQWHRYFLDLTTAHVAVLRAFLPRLPEGGTYTLILGGSAHTPVPGSSIISMEQAALRAMTAVVGEEAAGRVSVHGMLMGPVATRQRSYVDPEMITADEVGYLTTAYAAVPPTSSGEAILRSHADVAAELDAIGYEPVPRDGVRGASGMPDGWPALPADLERVAVTPNEQAYAGVRSSYMQVGHPAVVFVARSEADAQAAVVYAAAVREKTGERVPFSVRSGGHGIAGSSTNSGGVVLDLSQLNHVEAVTPDGSLVRAQAGATWGKVAGVLSPYGRALTSGNFGDTGVGGLATAGGLGYFARSQGLTLDHVRRVRVLAADGTTGWVDAENDPDVFWAIRGGATQAGIALDFILDAPALAGERAEAMIVFQEVQYLIDDLPAFTAAWGAWMREAPRQAESFLMLHSTGDGRAVVQARTVWADDDVQAATPTLQAALSLGPVMQQSARVVPYTAIVPTPRQPHVGQQRVKMRDVLVDVADEALGAAMSESLAHRATLVGELRAMGGAIGDVPVADTAWAGRRQEVLAGTWANPVGDLLIDESFAPVHALGTGMYGAYSSDTSVAAAELAWPGETGRRLREVSARVDPHRLFDAGLVLPPL